MLKTLNTLTLSWLSRYKIAVLFSGVNFPVQEGLAIQFQRFQLRSSPKGESTRNV